MGFEPNAQDSIGYCRPLRLTSVSLTAGQWVPTAPTEELLDQGRDDRAGYWDNPDAPPASFSWDGYGRAVTWGSRACRRLIAAIDRRKD